MEISSPSSLVTATSLERLSISIVRDLYNLDWIGSLRCDIVIMRDDLLPLADLASHWPACAVNAMTHVGKIADVDAVRSAGIAGHRCAYDL